MNIFNKLLLLAAIWALVVPLSADAEEPTEVHDAIVIVLDGSGSMDERMPDPVGSGAVKKIDVAKRAIGKVVPQMPKGTHVGLLVFDRSGINWNYPLSELDIGLFSVALNQVRADGSTPLGTSIEEAGRALLGERRTQLGYGNYKLIVVTDGEASGRHEDLLMKQRTQQLTSHNGIRVDVIGVAMPGGEQHSLSQVASSYQPANDAVELEKTLQKAIMVEAGGNNAPVDFDETASVDVDVARVWLKALSAPPPNYYPGEEPTEEHASSAGTATSPGGRVQPTGCNSSGVSEVGSLIAFFLGLIAILITRQDNEPPQRRRPVPVRVRIR